MLSWVLNERKKIQLWLPHDGLYDSRLPVIVPFDKELDQALRSPDVNKIAWYAGFERNTLKQSFGHDIPIEQWRDPMILARSLSMPGRLEKVCKILKLGKDEEKIEDGKRLIKLF